MPFLATIKKQKASGYEAFYSNPYGVISFTTYFELLYCFELIDYLAAGATGAGAAFLA